MNKLFFILSLLALSLSSYGEEVPVFLECGECKGKGCDNLSELAGKPDKLIKINNLPKESTSGNSEGKIFGSHLVGYAWKSVKIKYDALTVYVEYERPVYKTSNSKDTYEIDRGNLKLNYGPICKLITEEELEEKANDIIKIIMNLNQI